MTLSWRKASPSNRRLAAGVLCAILLASAIINLVPAIEEFVLNRPPTCTLKILTNVPCLGCRGTRAGFAFAHGHLGQAIAQNPLATLFGVTVAGWSLLLTVTGRIPTLKLGESWQSLAWVIFGFVLLGNWIYVIAAGG